MESLSRPLILVSSIMVCCLMVTMQYSGAQNVLPVSKEGPLTPDEEPGMQGQGGGEEPIVPDNNKEPEAQTEEPREQKEEPSGADVGEGEPEVKGEDKQEEKTTTTPPGKRPTGGLDIANTTQQALPPAYKITIKFHALWPGYISGFTYNCNLGGCGAPGPKHCANWNLAAYMQGKLVKISEIIPRGLKACNIKDPYYGSTTSIYFVPSVTVEIPGESVQDIRDYRPLSIFTVGWQNDSSTCPPPPMNAPEELPEVQRILVDKSSTHSDAKEKIASIQHQLQNQLSVGCTPVKPTTTEPSVATSYLQNQRLDTVNILLPPPGYGMELGTDHNERDGIYVRNCDTSPFCISYYIDCPLCVKIRQH